MNREPFLERGDVAPYRDPFLVGSNFFELEFRAVKVSLEEGDPFLTEVIPLDIG